ncbi:MAG: putative oxidoreductase YdhV [Planctomycetes bacterium]|nr:putative oxidoreductase YdhV [Planctomycetota bacterium]
MTYARAVNEPRHGGWHGSALAADVSSGTSERVPIGRDVLRRFIGGAGLGAWLLARHGDPAGDPLAPDAPFVVSLSPLVGTPLTTSAKFAVVAKSPLTHRFCDALSSDRFAIELKGAGIDALVVRGRCAEWSVLVVEPGGARLIPAGDLAGLPSAEAERRLLARFPQHRFFGIGPAGENGVLFATVSGDGRHAGRGGLGAVLGSKRLKGILARGGVPTPLADAGAALALAKDLSARSLGPATAKYREIGTVANLLLMNRLGALPARNFSERSIDGAESLSAESLRAAAASVGPVVRKHCASCTIGCEHVFPRAGGKDGVRMEYEGLFALGPLCGITDREVVVDAAGLCDDLGLDVISAGGTIAFAMECAQHGLLPGGPRFGDGAALLALLRDIADRRGVGALLADGSRRAAERLGPAAEPFAMHVKGLELPGYDPRALRTMGLGLAVSHRGADHNRSGAYEADFAGSPEGDDAAGAAAAASEVRSAILDSLILCKFLRGVFTDLPAEGAAMLAAVTGEPFTAASLREAGERTVAARKLWNDRAGWTPAEDTLPERLLGRTPGEGLGRASLDRRIAAYRRAHGWDERGSVPAPRVAALQLDDLFPAPDEVAR